MPTRAEPARMVGFLLVPGFPLLSYAAAVEPLRAANQLSGCELYGWRHASPDGAIVKASNGLAVVPDLHVGDEIPGGGRLFVCAGGNPSTFSHRRVFSWLRAIARRGTAVGGISGGPYALARAGLLDGRRCTLHWEHIPAFQETFPDARVARSLYEIDDDRITCSGGIAALDMMLRLVGEDHGPELAAAVGDWFLHNRIREGLAPQRMSLPLRLDIHDARLLRAVAAIEANLERPLSRQDLADVACLSVRQLERLFRDDLGQSLHRHYLQRRIEQAARLQRETALTMAEIASATGFASAAELRRVQRRGKGRTGTSGPEGDYRGSDRQEDASVTG